MPIALPISLRRLLTNIPLRGVLVVPFVLQTVGAVVLVWQIVTVIPQSHFMAAIQHNTRTTILLCLLTLGTAIALGLFAANQLTACFAQFNQVSRELAAGNLDQRLPIDSPISELNNLAQSFNQMADQLQQSFDRIQTALAESEEKFTIIFRSSPDPIALTTLAEGRCVEANASFFDVLEYSREELIGQRLLDLGIWGSLDDRARFREALQQNGHIRNLEVHSQTQTGQIKTILVSAELIEINGETYILGIGRDISDRARLEAERKYAEETLRQSEALNRAILNALPDLIIRMDRDGTYLDFKPTADFPLVAPNLKAGDNIRHILPPEVAQQRLAAIATALQTAEMQVYEFPLRLDGQDLWQEARVMPLNADEVLIVIRDLTQRHQFEEALQLSEARYRGIVDDQTELISRFQLDGTLTFVNAAYCRYFELDPETAVGRSYQPVVFEADRDRVAQLINSVSLENPTVTIENRVFSDGAVRWTQWNNRAIFDEQRRLIEFQSVGRDISDRKQAEIALQESEARFRELAETVREGFFVFETETAHYSYVNPAYEAIIGTSPQLIDQGMSHWLDNIHPDDRDRIEVALQQEQQGENFDHEYRYILPQGELRWLRSQAFPLRDGTGSIVRVVGTVEDISDRKRVEDERKQAEIALQESEARFQEIAQTLNQVSYVISLTTGQYLYISPSYEKLWGYSCESLYQDPNSWLNRIYPEDSEYVLWEFNQLLSGNQKRLQYRITCANGDVRWIESESLVVYDDDGNPLRIVGVADDITARKQLEESLKLSEARYRAIVEDQIELICRYQPNGTLTFANETFCRYFGLDPAEVLGSRYEPLIYEADRDGVHHLVSSMSQDNPTVTIENRVFSHGELRWTQWNSRAIFEQGHFIEFQSVGRDITDRKQAEAEIQQLNQQLTDRVNELQTLFEVLPIGVAIGQDPDCRVARINPCLSEILRVSLDANASPGAPVAERPAYRVYRDGQELSVEELPMQYASAHNIEVRDEVVEIVHADGTVIQLLSYASPLRDEQGKVRGSIGGFVDISDRKQTEAALRDSEERFRRAFDDAPIGMSLISLTGRFLKVNEYYCNLVGYTEEELFKLTFQDITHPDDLKEDIEGLGQMLVGEIRSFQMEKRYITKLGAIVPVLMSTAPIRDHNGQPLYCVGHIQDIRDRLKVERMKDEFVSVVSHELRTPLTSIRGALGILDSGVFHDRPEKAQHMLKIALNNSDRLVRLVNDILDLERLESGKVQLVMEQCQVSALMRQAVDGIQAIADQSAITLSLTPLSATLWAAPDAIIQTLTNLLSNAIKFSSPGDTVWLKAELGNGWGTDEADKQNSSALSVPKSAAILFSITDQGRGIPADKLELIFEQFQQVDVSDSREKGGTGLGLAICKNIVQQHDGQIWAESTLGKGSTFYFTLPLFQVSGSRF